MNDHSETSITTGEESAFDYEAHAAFTTAVRAVLSEMVVEYTLPIPMRIGPNGGGVELQVSQDEFDAWVGVLAGPNELSIDAPAHEVHYYDGVHVIEHVSVSGTINGAPVKVITVRDVKPAVA